VQALRLTLGGYWGDQSIDNIVRILYLSVGVVVPRITSSGQQRLGIIRVRALLFLESLLRASSALVLFECGLSCPSKRTAYILRVQVILSLEVHCSYYSNAGSGPSNYSLLASSALVFFECGLRSLESFSSGQQRLHIIRVRAPVPRIAFFRLAAPPYSSSAGFGPLNRFLWANSASMLFECGLWSLKSLSSGQ
jgi:hypothetical protein